MRRAHVLALVAVLALAGCPGAAPAEDTVTPAPVPESVTQAGVASCDVPTVPSSAPTTEEFVDPAWIPVEDRVVNASALVSRHDRVLRNHSYRLSGPGLSVQADPSVPALGVHARSSILTVRHYVVEDTRYTFYDGPGGQDPYQVHEYDAAGIPDDFGSFYSLTGRNWLANALAVAPHRVGGRYPNGGVELRATPEGTVDADGTSIVGPGSIRSLESTVTVDQRGIVRSVAQRFELVRDGEVVRRVNHSFAVTDVGTATVERPEWVCFADRAGLFEAG